MVICEDRGTTYGCNDALVQWFSAFQCIRTTYTIWNVNLTLNRITFFALQKCKRYFSCLEYYSYFSGNFKIMIV